MVPALTKIEYKVYFNKLSFININDFSFER